MLDLGPEIRDGDDDGGAGILRLLGELGDSVEGIHGGGDGAEGGDSEEAGGEIGGVWGEEEDDGATGDAKAAGEAESDARDQREEVGE